MRTRLTLAALVAASAAHAQAPAPLTSLPDTIVTGTRVPTPAERVPAAITVLTRRDIEERGYQTLAEALREVPGVRLAPTGGPGSLTTAFVRGANSSQTVVLLDGVPINDPATTAGEFNFSQDLLFDVERIEVIRGPFSTLYGSGAIGGAINLVTRRAAPDRPLSVFGEAAGGTRGTYRAGGGATGTVGAFDYLFSGNTLATEGFNTVPPRIANEGERDGFRGYAATARLGWTPYAGARVEGLLRWRENSFGLDNAADDDPNYRGRDRRWTGQLRTELPLFDGVWTTGLRGFRTEDRRGFRNEPDTLDPFTERSRFRGERTGIEWGNTVRLPSVGRLDAGAIGFGITHALEEARSTQVFGGPFGNFSAPTVRASQHTTAGFASLQYRAFQRLDLTAGLRHDAVTGFTDETTWRVGAVLALPEIDSRLRASVGTAFRAPSLFQRFGVGAFFRGNPDLKPERSLGWEVGGDTDLRLLGRERFATGSWTYFGSRVRSLIVSDPSFSTLENIDRARIEGAELGLTLRPHRLLESTVNWTLTESFDDVTDQRLLRRPQSVVSVTARVTPLPGVTIAPVVLFTGRGPDVLYDNSGNFTGRGSNRAGTVVDLTVNWQALPQAAVFVEARNLGNSRYEPVNGFVTPGRSVLVGTRFAL